MQFGFKFQISLFSTSVRFSPKTLPYLAYKAFIAFKAYKAFRAFKRSRLSPFQKYRSVISFSVDWPRTIRLVDASVSILSVCTIKLQVIVNQNRCNSIAKTTTPEQIQIGLTQECYKQKSRGSSCDPALTVHDNVNHHQDNKRDQHVNTFILIGSQLVVMVLRAQRPLGTIAQLFHFVAEEKKRRQKKQRRFMSGLPQVSQ